MALKALVDATLSSQNLVNDTWGMVEVVVAHSFAHVRWGQRQLELDFSRIMRDMYIVRPASRAHVVGPPPPAPAPPLDAPALVWMSHHRLRRHLRHHLLDDNVVGNDLKAFIAKQFPSGILLIPAEHTVFTDNRPECHCSTHPKQPVHPPTQLGHHCD